MRERDGQDSEHDTLAGGSNGPDFIEGSHGRHGGSEESEGAPQERPRHGEQRSGDESARHGASRDAEGARTTREGDASQGARTDEALPHPVPERHQEPPAGGNGAPPHRH